VESGIPPFRGTDGLWNRYDPMILDIDYFYKNPLQSWQVIKEIFYDYFGRAKPNRAHEILAVWEQKGLVKATVTQNIDNLHQQAGSHNVIEFHGTSSYLRCDNCQYRTKATNVDLNHLPPLCPSCKHVLRPDFVFSERQSRKLKDPALSMKQNWQIYYWLLGPPVKLCQHPSFLN